MSDKSDKPRKGALSKILIVFVAIMAGFLIATGGMNETLAYALKKEGQAEVDIVGKSDSFSFIDLPPVVVSYGQGNDLTHLKFHAKIEVQTRNKKSVEKVTPRLVDVMNTYLRALKVESIHETGSLIKIRSHLLRRFEVVAGLGSLNDLLIMEFVIN